MTRKSLAVSIAVLALVLGGSTAGVAGTVVLGDAFTDEVKEAWTVTYTTLATVMIEASKEVAA